MNARMRIAPPQTGHASGSTASVFAGGPSRLFDGSAPTRRGRRMQALEYHGIPRAVTREPLPERHVAIGAPHGVVHVEPRVRPREHRAGVFGLEDPAPHEEPEHRAPERFRQRHPSDHAERPGCTARTRCVSPRRCREHRPNLLFPRASTDAQILAAGHMARSVTGGVVTNVYS